MECLFCNTVTPHIEKSQTRYSENQSSVPQIRQTDFQRLPMFPGISSSEVSRHFRNDRTVQGVLCAQVQHRRESKLGGTHATA